MRFAAHIHCAVIGDDLVLLDLRSGRYAGVPGGRTRFGVGEDRRTLNPATPHLADRLRARGWVVPERADVAPPSLGFAEAAPERPTRDLRDLRPARGGAVDALRLAASAADLGRDYWRRSLLDILRRARRAPRGPVAADPETLRLAGLFDAWSVWAPAPAKCLARSFMLLRFLQRSGRDAVWVFGVRAWPFRAHCWLQAGDVVLDDAPERLAVYEPILAV